jgi:hypothetical protein
VCGAIARAAAGPSPGFAALAAGAGEPVVREASVWRSSVVLSEAVEDRAACPGSPGVEGPVVHRRAAIEAPANNTRERLISAIRSGVHLGRCLP